MTEAVALGYIVVLGSLSCVAGYEGIELLVVGVSEEDGLDVSIVDTHVLHAVFLLVGTGELMLLDDAIEVVIHISTHDETILGLTVHGLRIYVVLLLLVLHEPALFLEAGKVLGCLVIYTRVVLVGAHGEIDLGLDDMIERHFVAFGFGTCLVRVEHVVGTALHLLHQCFGWADAFEWFDYCHKKRMDPPPTPPSMEGSRAPQRI